MDDAPNPFAPPKPGWDGGLERRSSVAVGEERTSLPATKFGTAQRWSVTLHPAHVRLVGDTGQEIVLDREEFLQHVSVFPRSEGAFLTVRKPPKIALLLGDDVVQRIKEWVGPDRERWLRIDLRRLGRSTAITGLIFGAVGIVLDSWLVLTIAAADLVGGALLFALVDRRLFIAHTAIGFLAAVLIAYDAVIIGSGWWLLCFLPVLWFGSAWGLRRYRFHG